MYTAKSEIFKIKWFPVNLFKRMQFVINLYLLEILMYYTEIMEGKKTVIFEFYITLRWNSCKSNKNLLKMFILYF